MLTLYNVISSDGCITTKDGDESFIPDSLWPTVLDVFREYDVFLMGKNTYRAFQEYGDDLLIPFEALDIRKVVVSRDASFKPKDGYEAVQDSKDILANNEKVVVSSGPGFNNYLLENKLIGRMIIHKLPEALGDGIKPFDDAFLKEFKLVSSSPKGMIEEFAYSK